MKRMIKASTNSWQSFGDVNPLEGCLFIKKDTNDNFDIVGVYPYSDEDGYLCFSGYVDGEDVAPEGWMYDIIVSDPDMFITPEHVIEQYFSLYGCGDMQPDYIGEYKDGAVIATEDEVIELLHDMGIK